MPRETKGLNADMVKTGGKSLTVGAPASVKTRPTREPFAARASDGEPNQSLKASWPAGGLHPFVRSHRTSLQMGKQGAT